MRGAGSDRHRYGQTEARLPVVCDAVGDSATIAGPGRIPARGTHRRSVAASSGGKIRHASRHGNASRETQAVRPLAPQAERINATGEGCGNDGRGENEGKPNPGFPSFSPALGNRCAIPTFPPPRRGAEKWKTKTQFSTFPLAVIAAPKPNKKGDPAADRSAPAFRLILQ